MDGRPRRPAPRKRQAPNMVYDGRVFSRRLITQIQLGTSSPFVILPGAFAQHVLTDSRAATQWVGGAGAAVSAVSLLPALGVRPPLCFYSFRGPFQLNCPGCGVPQSEE